MAVEKPSLEELRRTRNIHGVVLVIVVLVTGLVTVGFATKLKKDNSDEQPSPPFRITDLADQEKLCEAIKESDEFDFEDTADVPVYVSCQVEETSIFGCRGDGSLLNGADFCDFFGGVCPCEPGLIIDGAGLEGEFDNICVDEVNPNNPLCDEFKGDLAGLLAVSNSPVSSPTDLE